MREHLRQSSHGTLDLVPFSSDGSVGAAYRGCVLVAGGWLGVGVAHAAGSWSSDPTSGRAVLWTAGVAVVSLVAIGGGTVLTVTGALSPTRHVFLSRPAFWTAGMFLALAAVTLGLLILRAPFDGIAAHGKPLPELIGDLTCIAASLIYLVGGGVALRGGWEGRRNERNWGRSST